jgi:CspA family cold shock protein
MNVTGFYYLEGALFFGFLVAVGLTVIRLNRPEYGVARRSIWVAAILFGSVAVVWSLSTVESAWIKISAVAIVGMIVAIYLTEALLIKNRKFPTQSNSVASDAAAQPTLEITNKSAIDASRATIPGDLTKTDNGWQTKPHLQFPAAPTRFTLMSTPELKRQLHYTAHDLQRIQDQFTTEIGKAGPDRTSAVLKKYTTMYEEQFSTLAFSLASAALPRIGMLSNVPRRATSGGQLLYYKTFPGPTSAGDIAAFLDLLSSRLPVVLEPVQSRGIVQAEQRERAVTVGTVKWFNAKKGYGFIQPQGGGKDVFVHISAVERAGLSNLNEGQRVEYEEVANKGKTTAENLKVK